MSNLTTSQQAAIDDTWLPPEPTRRLTGLAFHPCRICDPSSPKYDPSFPKATKGRWRKSELLNYMASRETTAIKNATDARAADTQPPAQPTNPPRDRRAITDRRQR